MLNELIKIVESDDFELRHTPCSDIGLIIKCLKRSTRLQVIISDNKGNREYGKALLQYVNEILDRKFDLQYASPYDEILTGYIWVLYNVDPIDGFVLSTRIKNSPNLWWARQISHRLQDDFHQDMAMGMVKVYEHQIKEITDRHEAHIKEENQKPMMQRQMSGSYWASELARVRRLREQIQRIKDNENARRS